MRAASPAVQGSRESLQGSLAERESTRDSSAHFLPFLFKESAMVSKKLTSKGKVEASKQSPYHTNPRFCRASQVIMMLSYRTSFRLGPAYSLHGAAQGTTHAGQGSTPTGRGHLEISST